MVDEALRRAGARAELAGRGVEIGEPFHFGAEGQVPGLAPERTDYGTYLTFSDPDGNVWLVQEVGHQAGQVVTNR